MRRIYPVDYKMMPKRERDTIDAWLKSNGIVSGSVCLLEFYDGGGSRVTRLVEDSERIRGIERYTTELTTQPTIGDQKR